jgi:signal transduction histidine kinase
VKLTIAGKMMVGFVVVIALMVMSNAYILFELQAVSRVTTTALTADARSIDIANQLHTLIDEEERLVQKYVISNDTAYQALAAETRLHVTNLLDSLGAVVAQRPLFRRPINEIDRSYTWLLSNLPHTSEVGLAQDLPSTGRDRSEAIGYIHATLDQIIAFSKSSITISLADVEQKTSRSARLALFLTAGTLLAATALAFGITRTITRPLTTLIRGTEQITQGSFDRIAVTSSDEIAQLTAAFNSMGDRLNAINTYKAEMMAQISHEIRTPLQLMLSSHFLLTERSTQPLDETQRRLLGSIRDSIERIARFSDRFLGLAKIEAGMMEYRFTTVDFAALVRRAVEDASIVAAQRNIRVTLQAQQVPLIMADEEKCSQVISNLLGNAVKYTGEGGSVNVTVAPCTDGVELLVTDTGAGIAPKELPMIFTKFYRTSDAVHGNRKGTGLGLALVKALVEGHGGKVSVKSELGKGSSFSVEFPLIPPAGKAVQ